MFVGSLTSIPIYFVILVMQILNGKMVRDIKWGCSATILVALCVRTDAGATSDFQNYPPFHWNFWRSSTAHWFVLSVFRGRVILVVVRTCFSFIEFDDLTSSNRTAVNPNPSKLLGFPKQFPLPNYNQRFKYYEITNLKIMHYATYIGTTLIKHC